ncbi:MAG: FtsX-like permease family protein [Elusimicrobiales bacterium]|nr:FtsX-like permease family protein [Elusimicrobiales bacterium]
MKLIFTIAWRNILRHKGKSLVIGVILFTGAFLMTVGNGVISGMAVGIEKNIVNGFMGDLVLISEAQKSDNILLNMMGSSIEPVTTYKQIKEILAAQPYVKRFLPVGKNLAMVLDESTSAPGYAYLLGVDFAEYRKMFPDSFTVIEGSYPAGGQRTLLIPTFARDEFYDFYNIWFLPEGGRVVKENLKKEALANLDTLIISTNVVMMGMTSGINTTTDIRFPVKGIIRYGALNQIFGHFCLVDIESYRECLGYFTAADMAAQVPKEEKKLLGLEGGDLDSLFGEGMIVSDVKKAPKIKVVALNEPKLAEDGVYNAVFIKLNDGEDYGRSLKKLNKALAGTGVRAVTWNKASGPMGGMALIIKSALFIFVMLLFCVAVIIIVNTLTMSALERSSEIGMMRAVGAHKTFIAGMFLGETAVLSAVFGGAGILAGIVAVRIIPLLQITTKNDMLQLLYGGNFFNPLLSLSDVGLTALQLLFVTVVAAMYPMRVAVHITPLDAISRD